MIHSTLYEDVHVTCSPNCFRKKGFKVRSFGSGNQVKLPGSSADSPNVYNFNTTYDEMYQDLKSKDPALYPYHHVLEIGVHGMFGNASGHV